MNQTFEGLILFKRQYKEKDALVKIFTDTFGPKMFFVRGLSAMNHPLLAHTIPLTRHRFIGTIHNDGFSFLREAETIDAYRLIMTDPMKHAVASYVAQLLDAATPDNRQALDLYHLLTDACDKINQGASLAVVMTVVELQLLPIFGTHIDWDHCVICGRPHGPFDLSFREQGLLCYKHVSVDPHRLHADPNLIYLLANFARLPIKQLGQIALDDAFLQRLRDVMDLIMNEFVGLHLKSYSYLKQLLATEKQAKLLKNARQS